MKKITYTLSAMFMVFLWACGSASLPEDGKEPQGPDTQDPGDDTPAEVILEAPILKANVNSVTVDRDSDSKAVEFTWNDVSVGTVTPMYELVLAEENDENLEKAEVFNTSSFRKVLTHRELAEMVDGMGYSIDDPITLDVFVFASADGAESVSSNVLKLVLRPKPFEFSELYPVGAATPYGWNNKTPEAMVNNNNVFTCEIALTAGEDFKFLTSRAWWPGVVNNSTDPLEYKPKVYKTQPADELDRKFRVAESGTYRLTVDATDFLDIKMTAVLLAEDETSPECETIYIIGDAVTEYGYDLDKVTDDMYLTPVEGQLDTYTWTGHLKAFMDFKFQTVLTAWIPSYNRDATSSEYWKLVYRTSYSQPDEKFTVKTSGIYKITLNTKELTISCELVQEDSPVDGGDSPKAVFMGDSITEMWGKEEYGHPSFFTDNDYLCKGIGGQTTIQMFERFDKDVIGLEPECVVICGGTNDIAGNGGSVTNEALLNNIASMASKAEVAGIKVIICSILPCEYYYWNTEVKPAERIVEVNAMIRALAEQKGYTYVDYHSQMKNEADGLPEEYTIDGCHPSKTAYTLMEGIIKPVIESVIK